MARDEDRLAHAIDVAGVLEEADFRQYARSGAVDRLTALRREARAIERQFPGARAEAKRRELRAQAAHARRFIGRERRS
jgi:hypothetical protein